MNTKFTIKNFRVFDENGVSIDIKPMTILTGCNSSGKSSIVRAAFLINSFIKQVNNAIENGEMVELNKYMLDFTCYPNNMLGRFDKVIPNGSTNQNVTLGYTIHSCMLSKDVDVELVFSANKNDDLNNAYLISISMSTDEGVFYSSDKEKGNYYNLNIVKNYLASFAETKIVLDGFVQLFTVSVEDYSEVTNMPEKEIREKQKECIDYLNAIGKDKVMDVAKFLRFGRTTDIPTYTKDQYDILNNTEETGSFFNIPVLDYLHTIKKENIKGVVERELIANDEKNTYVAPHNVVLSASMKVLDDFMASSYDTFDTYFRESEKRFFEHTVVSGNNAPCLVKPSIIQDYLTEHPNGFVGNMDPIFFTWEKNEPLFKKAKTAEEKKKEWDARHITFENLYSVVMIWNEKYSPNISKFYSGGCASTELPEGTFDTPGIFHHHAFDMLVTFAEALTHEAISATGYENMSYVSSSRATVKKLYAMDEKDDFTELLKKHIEAKRGYDAKRAYPRPKYKVHDFMNRWLKAFGLGESLSFELDPDGLGVKIRLKKSKEDCGRLLADEGYGITQLISILLQIETAILSAKNKRHNNSLLRALDGYDEDKFHYEEITIAIEEPEIHLHPNYQSKLAEMFVDAYTNYNIHFVIETHSEYLIRKIQTLTAKKKIEADEISILYVYCPNIEQRPLYTPQVKSISIKPDGRLSDSFGPGFFDEADNSAMELLTLKEQEL